MSARPAEAASVLVVEHDPHTAQHLADVLESAGYRAWVSPTAADARAFVKRAPPDLIVLDLRLPDEDGLTLCAGLRDSTTVPIVVRAASPARCTVIDALRLGADDVVREPCEVDELLARIEAVLRRSRWEEAAAADRRADQVLQAGPLAIDQARYRVTLADQPVRLTPAEYRLLVALARRPGEVLSRQELEQLAWGPRQPARDGRRIDVCIHRLRRRLGLGGSAAGLPWLSAVRGHGYRLLLPG